MELEANLLIIDEKKGRKAARDRAVPLKGLLGILLEAKKKNYITDVKSYMDKLRENQFKIDNVLYNRILNQAGESNSSNNSIA